MRNINQIIVHCSATPPSMIVGADDIRKWHITRGWSDIGYHYVIRRNGVTEAGRDIEKAGAHAKGHNEDSIGICLIGGIDEEGKPDDNYTLLQYNELLRLINFLKITFPIKLLKGHRDLPGVTKACPCFDVDAWYKFEAQLTF